MIKTKLERQTQTRRNLSGCLSSCYADLPLGSAVEWLLKFFFFFCSLTLSLTNSLSLSPFNNISSDLAVDFLRTCLLLFRSIITVMEKWENLLVLRNFLVLEMCWWQMAKWKIRNDWGVSERKQEREREETHRFDDQNDAITSATISKWRYKKPTKNEKIKWFQDKLGSESSYYVTINRLRRMFVVIIASLTF